MKIRLIGPRGNMGVGIHFSRFADTLKAMSGLGSIIEEISSSDNNALLAAAQQSQPDDINICFPSIDLSGHYRGTNIQWIVFESTRVPEIIMSTMLRADVVWVPSNWGRQILVDNGLDPQRVDVVPEGVDTMVYHPYFRPTSDSALKFLSVGKYEQRKSQKELLMAWNDAFGNDPAVKLMLKTFGFTDAEKKSKELVELIHSMKLTNVAVYWGGMTEVELSELYKSSDVFVLPTKAEGWGLPLIEAAASGLPVITTRHSGHVHYLEHIESSVLWVDYDMAPITCPDFQWCYPTSDGNFGSWAVPRVSSISKCLSTARNNFVALKQQAVDNALKIRSEFSWLCSADHAVAALRQRGLL